ncbi:ABC transporter ATP-binding protein [Falsiroseomonas ponticola]|uniref:ABC transporter ATP-binding protein n=1 Tax=Falsiroseomonas ponticola TaxID=2786951 RepID=UPI0019334D69|nr:ABC transporter ATP-binding protein [Roseomonas ponticola]
MQAVPAADGTTGGAAPPVLSVHGLGVEFASARGAVRAVDGLSMQVARGEVFAIVGESGSGKSSVALAVTGLLPPSARVEGEVRLLGRDVMRMPAAERRRMAGEQAGLVCQDALSSLNPCTTVGFQIAETLMVHRGMAKRAAMQDAVRLLKLTGVPAPEERVHDYPHQFSGGMRQRALIAIALALDPALLIADEPTTALDATIKAQILDLLLRLRRDLGMSIVIITHDMGVVAKLADRMLVMYAGRAIEVGRVEEIFARPAHPYTRALLDAVPRLGRGAKDLQPIPGAPPSMQALPPGCAFHPRCPLALPRCQAEAPALVPTGAARQAACHLAIAGAAA